MPTLLARSAVEYQGTNPKLIGKKVGQDPDDDWTQRMITVDELEYLTGYDFFSNISTEIQKAIEERKVGQIKARLSGIKPTPLMAATDEELKLSPVWPIFDGAIGHSSIPNQVSTTTNSGIADQSIVEGSFSQNSIFKSITKFSSIEAGTDGIHMTKGSSPKVSFTQIRPTQINRVHISIPDNSASEASLLQNCSDQISSSQIGFGKISLSQVGSTQINLLQTQPSKVDLIPLNIQRGLDQFDSSKVTDSLHVASNQIFGSHLNANILPNHLNTPLLTNIYSTAQTLWNTTTLINLTFEITNLPTGQLAEATITGYNQLGRPNTATITIDDDANSVGWFLDTTPQDSSEFTGVDNYLQATPNSPASGKYDLLTTILHEMGHTLGIINGYSEFNKYVKGRQFITDTFTANLTPDGSHLDTTFHPYDLMNTSLKPGVRKLPSALNLAMIDAINAGVGGWVSGVGTLNSANLTAGALIGINNGDFATSTTWNTAGATNIINGTATLTEQSQKLSELTQAFIIPTGAKTLQFTIKDNHLVTGDTTKTANDAFEIALLDTNTFNPLAGTSQGLNHTDSLLNIQANGTIHKSDKVTITALGNNSSIVTIDLTQVTPSTNATLYFNLIGFGARTSTVTIDDVKLFTDTQPIPVTNNDTLITNQNTPFTLEPTQLTTNDTNVTQIQVINQPSHGTLTQTPDGKFTYQPVSTYVGTDSFTYLGFGSDGQISNLATVNLTVNNLPPTIETVLIPNQINEGQTIQLKATAKDGGSSDNLTYTWDLGDGSQPVIGQNITHQFVDNGTYNVNLTVADKDGGITQQSTQIKVDNVAPTATITTPNTTLNQGETLNLGVNYSDAGIKDTHTITWNFDDGNAPVTLVGALGFVPQPNLQSHVFTKAGTHNVTVTITDNDGASTTDTIQVTVTNVAPTINTVNIPTNINEGSTVQLTATASDAGNDTLTCNWYINGATTPIIGQTIDYNFYLHRS